MRASSVIDLSADSPELSSSCEASLQRQHGHYQPERKRRRHRCSSEIAPIELSDSEEPWPVQVSREQELSRERRRAERRERRREARLIEDGDTHQTDEQLARRLQEEEDMLTTLHAAREWRAADHFGSGPMHNQLQQGLPASSWHGVDHWSRHGSPGGLFTRLGQHMPTVGAGVSMFGDPPLGPSSLDISQLFGGSGPHGVRGSGRAGGGGRLAQLQLLNRDFGEQDYEMLLQLDEPTSQDRKKARSANAKLLEALPTRRVSKAEVKANDGEECTCVICLEGLRAQQQVITLPCKHEYHRPCILKWLKSCDTPTCPQCKVPVLAADDPTIDEDGEMGTARSHGRSVRSTQPWEPSPDQGEWWHT